MREVDLSAFRRSVTIGSDGAIRLDGIRSRHAVIAAHKDDGGNVVQTLHPLQGNVVVERGGQRFEVRDRWVLSDGDVIVVSVWRLTYRDLGAKRASNGKTSANKEKVEWHRP